MMAIYARLSTQWFVDPKVMGVSVAAELLYVRTIAHCVEQLKDGRIDRRSLPFLGGKLDDPDAAAKELVTAQLWLKDGRKGWRFPAQVWERWQRSSAEVEAVKEAQRERSRRWRDRHNGDVTRYEAVSNGLVTEPTPAPSPSPSPDVSTRTEPTSAAPRSARSRGDEPTKIDAAATAAWMTGGAS